MFTGLIEEVGTIKVIESNKLVISCKKIIEGSKVGDSIAVNGLCLTITQLYSDSLAFHLSKTTRLISRFKPGEVKIGEEVNLERALLPTTRLGGHIVLGHVDGKVKIISINKSGEDTFIELLPPKELLPFIVNKGSVALDGISLTVSSVLSSSFRVTVIPHTLSFTNLKNKRVGDLMHLEVDVIARYLNNFIKFGAGYGQNNLFD